jgi:hypothetical protein
VPGLQITILSSPGDPPGLTWTMWAISQKSPGDTRIPSIMCPRPGSFDYIQAIGLATIVASLLLVGYILLFM